MSEITEKQEDQKGSVGEPPLVVKHIIWLLNRDNWRKHWKAIGMGLLITVAVGVVGAVGIIPKIFGHKPEKLSFVQRREKEIILDENQVRRTITKTLHDGDIEKAIKFLSHIDSQSSARTEECERIFDFCVKNSKLDYAETVVNFCWEGKQKQEKLSLIEQERLKQ